jgi:hypothetical protein
MSYVNELAQKEVDALAITEADQEREMLEEKRQYEEAEARLAETRKRIRELRKHLEPAEEARITRAKKA